MTHNNSALCLECTGSGCRRCNGLGIAQLIDYINEHRHSGKSQFQLAFDWQISVEHLVEQGYRHPFRELKISSTSNNQTNK